jgi:hypothetical protein
MGAGGALERGGSPEQVGVSLESLLRAGAVLGLVLYGLGLMTVNAYLLSYGVHEFGLVRPQYIITGAIVALPAGIAAAGFVLADEGPDEFSRLSTWLRLAVAILPVLLSSLIFQGVTDSAPLSIVLTVSGAAAVILGVRVFRSVEQLGQLRSQPTLTWLPSLVGYGLTFLIVAAVYVWMFASYVYEEIPPHLGGGQPIWATLVTDAPGIESNAPEGMVNAVLIAELDDEYLLALPYERHIIRLRKEAVDAIFLWLPWTRGSERFFVPSPSPST